MLEGELVTQRWWTDDRLNEATAELASETEVYGACTRVANRLSKRWQVEIDSDAIYKAFKRHGRREPISYVGSGSGGWDVAQDPFAVGDPEELRDTDRPADATAPVDIDPRLIDYASLLQREALYALLRHRDEGVAAQKLGITVDSLRERVASVRATAARAGYSPEHNQFKTVPTGYHVRGVSTLYDKDGNVSVQWVKSQRNREYQHEMLVEAMRGLAEPFAGKSETTPGPKDSNADLLSVFPMGDPHFGMLSWHIETGEDFDLKLAEQQLVSAVDKLVSLSPPSEHALVINLGDFFHTDNSTNRTLRSGNALDVDSRWSKILSVGVRAMRRCIDRAAEKHKFVHVVNEIGNHDDHSAIMLSLCLEQYYSNNPRVTIDTSPSLFHWYRFGKCLIGVNHGDKAKAQDLPGIMATDRAKDWGETEFRYWYVGHVHHDRAREYPGCMVESFRTLAPKDAWHAGMGYRSGRDMKCDVLHKNYGRILRHTVGISMLEAS